MKDTEIIETCRTKEGCLEYITTACRMGCNEAYLPSNASPVILELEAEGLVTKKVKYGGLEFWTPVVKEDR